MATIIRLIFFRAAENLSRFPAADCDVQVTKTYHSEFGQEKCVHPLAACAKLPLP